MSNRKLTKFPVIAADGTEYRVTLKEMSDSDGDRIIRVKFYLPRKRFGFKKVASYDMVAGWTYDPSSPDYIAIARQVFKDFSRSELAVAQRKSTAIDAFQAWDGRL
ncbi:hypothetical protein [Paenibacillus illinoisensis]|uniref:hypothetical protein n=1 Tax=Paenibacillus illinoisensis TaxID=59845 RepID=UPI00203BF1A6|nr:hypothetical protein [Paenibacillus illinoisensis]MCM3205679.1 hypothetical protein [Paenibacillus illinoisensis]